MALKIEGTDKYSELIEQNIDQAKYLTKLINKNNSLELLSPTSLNIVNFRFNNPKLDDAQLNEINSEILMKLHESGNSAPSSALLSGNFSLRVAICNHRSRRSDFDDLVKDVINIGNQLLI